MKQRRAAFVVLILLLTALLLLGCGAPSAATPPEPTSSGTAPLPPTDTFSPPFSDEPSGEEFSPIEGTQTPAPAEAPPAEEKNASYIAACAMENVNVRAGASTSYPILFTLKKGDSLPYLGKEGNWLVARTTEGVGYLYADFAFLTETSSALEEVIRAGLKKLGAPYEWGAPRILTSEGAVSPYFTGKSFACSSFVQYCFYVGCGVKLGNYTGSQADHTVGEKITSYEKLKRGDFYFTGVGKISHVVIYLGGNLLLQTYSANVGPVSVTSDERWKQKFLSGRRPDLSVTEQFR